VRAHWSLVGVHKESSFLGGGLKFIFLHRPAVKKNRRAKEMSAWGVIPQQRKKKKRKKRKRKGKNKQKKKKNEAGANDRDQLCEVAAK